jgi:hypothetical protein
MNQTATCHINLKNAFENKEVCAVSEGVPIGKMGRASNLRYSSNMSKKKRKVAAYKHTEDLNIIHSKKL